MQAVLVKDGARCEVFMCEATGGVDGAAVEVSGNKSRLNMQDSRVSGALACLLVRSGGNAEVEGTFFEGSETGAGCRVRSTGTQVTLSGCTLTDNGAPGLDVADGASVSLCDCLIASNNLAGGGSSGSKPGSSQVLPGRNAIVSGLGSRVFVGDGVEIGVGGAEAILAFEGGEVEREERLSGDWEGVKLLLHKGWGNRVKSGEVSSGCLNVNLKPFVRVGAAAGGGAESSPQEVIVESLTSNLAAFGVMVGGDDQYAADYTVPSDLGEEVYYL